ncbi:Odorant-binding protein 23 isoform X2 [Halyomorpha halys]|uniref:Odorant-binding protein 23 n=2 Tax=Halyomorpha halys TaxID=286706 RepID=A0A1L2JGR1_HALHY|nr:odorant-binding protein 23 [Halyomorpha halys]KAE8573008.1 Odorant-binding protein 23 isoform X2 [Halyomorpha halys]
MNRVVIVVALILACIFNCHGQANPEIKAAVNECRSQHNIEAGQIKDAINNKKIPETEHGQCFMSCVMKKMGVLKNGKIDLDRVSELINNKFKDQENREKAYEIAKRCANVKSPDGKECSQASEMAKCALKNAIELKMEVPKGSF